MKRAVNIMSTGNSFEIRKEKVNLTKDGNVGIITLNSPQSMNALDDVLFAELSEVTDILLDDPSIGVIMLTGTGNAFCAGGDLKKLDEGMSALEGYTYMKGFHPWVARFMNSEKLTVAAVNGFAIGAGFCIAMMADMIFASETAKFGMAFGNVGLIPDLAGLYTLPRVVGLQRAKELVFTCRNISAQQAMDLGIVTEVTAPDQLMEKTLAMAARLASGPRAANKLAKMLLNSSMNMPLDQLLAAEAATQALCFQTKDHRVATQAFFKKENPVFIGE